MKHIKGRATGTRTQRRSGTFTGEVWADPLVAEEGVTMNTVYFTPGGRTHWHTHEGGQVIHVTAGQGWVATRSGGAVQVRTGDTVWTPPGEEHWHGASDHSMLVHVAVSIGKTSWLGEVDGRELAETVGGGNDDAAESDPAGGR